MIQGIVNNFDEPIIKLDIYLSSNNSKKVNAIIDTGFNGYISIPATLIEESNWDFLGTEEHELANGDIVEEKVYRTRGCDIRTAGALIAGIHSRTLYGLLNNRILEQVSRGVYRLIDIDPFFFKKQWGVF